MAQHQSNQTPSNGHLKIQIIKKNHLGNYGFTLANQTIEDKLTQLYKESIEKFNNSLTNPHRDSGFDLFSYVTTPEVTEYFEQKFGSKKPLTMHLFVKCAVYDDNGNPLPYYLYPRSSISKTSMRLANSIGIIDSGYRGELMAKVDLLSNNNDDETICELYGYKRHFQLCSNNLLPFSSVELVDNLDNTIRGSGGFGSTG